MKNAKAIGLCLLLTLIGLQAVSHEVLVVVGAPGEKKYAEGFKAAAKAWKDAETAADARIELVGLDSGHEEPVKERIQTWFENLDTAAVSPAWLVYIGHGTYNRRDAYLNLNGPDLSATELAAWIPTMDRTFIFVHGGSAGSPFLKALTGENRIILSATRNPDEINYSRFGEYFARVVSTVDGDIDQDGQTSLLEAFLTTADRVEGFYKDAGRLASEHALIDDNGDALGTPPDWFRGTRVTKESKGGQEPDGFRAHQIALVPSELEKALTPEQRSQRDDLEAELEVLRKKKNQLNEEEYYAALETILQQLSAIYLSSEADQADSSSAESDDS